MLPLVVAIGCREKKAEQFTALPFPDVMVPAVINTQNEAAEYLAEHWWDRLTDPERGYPCDSVLISGVSRSDVEQKFANWTVILGAVSYDHAVKSVSSKP